MIKNIERGEIKMKNEIQNILEAYTLIAIENARIHEIMLKSKIKDCLDDSKNYTDQLLTAIYEFMEIIKEQLKKLYVKYGYTLGFITLINSIEVLINENTYLNKDEDFIMIPYKSFCKKTFYLGGK